MTAYATRGDLYKFGLPRGTLGGGARLAASALAASDAIELDEHGFETNDVVFVRAAEGGSLPAPLAEGAGYYAIRVSSSSFKLSASLNGGAIDFTTDGVTVLAMAPLPFDDVLEYYSRFVDELVPANAVPLAAPYPVVIVATVAELAAKKLQNLAGHQTVSVDEAEKSAEARLARWAAGLPLRTATTAGATNLAVRAGATGTLERRRREERIP